MTVELQYVDATNLALSRLAYQFKNSENLKSFISVFTAQANDLQNSLFDLLFQRDLNSAIGFQLDILGQIVGQPRILTDAGSLAFFGFQDLSFPDDPQTQFEQGFGDLTNPAPGGLFLNLGQSPTGNITLDDNSYRLFLRARILKNYTDASPESLIQILKFIYGPYPINIVEGTASVKIFFGRILNQNEKILLNYEDDLGNRLIPITLGVGVEWGEFPGSEVFSFFEDPSPGLGFDDLTDPGHGGTFANLIT